MPARITVEELLKRIERIPDGCWQWRGLIAKSGYGFVKKDGKTFYAHRFWYEYFVGSIPAGLTIDHLCANRSCVNPDHLEPVTRSVNTKRAWLTSPVRQRPLATHCKHGHVWTEESTRITTTRNRQCRICKRSYELRAYHARKVIGS